MPKLLLRLLLLLAFFLSGFSTLIYEIVWVKHLVYLFGVTYHAITTVVTVFMAGLALGALFAGRYVDRSRRPLRLYAGLELFIGVWGLLFPFSLVLVTALYHQVHDLADVGFFAHIMVRFVLGCLLLLPPTVAMGATLPALARFFVLSRQRVGPDLGRLYGINTLGAALGCACTGFLLMTALGLARTNLLAVGLNLAAAAIAFLLSRSRRARRRASAPQQESPAPASLPRRLLLGVFFLSGFTGVAYEILWTRIVALFHPNAHTLVFALVLTLFLVGTGLGSGLYTRNLAARLHPLRLYAALQLGLGLVAVACPFLLVLMRDRLQERWYLGWAPAQQHLDLYLSWGEVLVVALAVGLPGLFYGMTFPLGNRLHLRRFSLLGSGVGAVYFFSTVGGIAGSFMAGFFLMPWLGAKGSLFAMAALNLGLGAALMVGTSRVTVRLRWALGALAALLLAGGALGFSTRLPDWVFLNIPTRSRVDFYRDGRSTTDAAIWVDQRGQWTKMLFANGEFVSSGPIGAWLALELHPVPEKVLILAFDTGATSANVTEDPRTVAVEAADISDVQALIAPHFVRENRNVLANPSFRMVANDGRNHLLTRRDRYQVIFNGVAAYSAYLELSTKEFFQLCRDRLTDDGIYLHKLHPHMLTPEGFRRVLATFAEVFPMATLWRSRVSSVLLLLGWPQAQRLDYPGWAQPLRAEGAYDPQRIAAMMLLGNAGLRSIAGDAPILTDDRPPRLRDTLTLVDTGSDFITSYGAGSAHVVYDREIEALIAQALDAPDALFAGLDERERAGIEALRAEGAIAMPPMRRWGGR